MNPIWAQMAFKAVKEMVKTCTQCKKSATYPKKRPGQFYKCRHCGHRFKEKGV